MAMWWPALASITFLGATGAGEGKQAIHTPTAVGQWAQKQHGMSACDGHQHQWGEGGSATMGLLVLFGKDGIRKSQRV